MLEALAPDLWVQAVYRSTLGLWLRRQLVIVRLLNGGLWVPSPIPWHDGLWRELAPMGPVRPVDGPTCFHDECLREFQQE